MVTTTSRLNGVDSGLGLKAPVKAATTANITLTGEQTIDSVAVVTGDRVLVKNQTTASENGIYDVGTSDWTRSRDFNGARDAVQGTRVAVAQGNTNAGREYRITTSSFEIGTDSISWTLVLFETEANVTASAASASAAASSASAASTSASNASTSASNASTSASNAATSASNASTSASNASTSASAAAASAVSAAASAAQLIGTSTTSNSIGTGSKSFTTQSGKFFSTGYWLLIVSDANPTVNYMHGQVTAYSGTALTVNVTNTGGSGTLTDWTIAVAGTRGAQGPAGSPGAGTGDMLGANNLSDVANAGTSRTNLGLGTAAVQAASYFNQTANNLSDVANASTARTNLGLGTIATQAANSVSITGGSITGITDLVVADGGTGASTFTDAGVLIGNGTGAIQVTSAGTSGHVLTSNGAGVDPTFQAASVPSGGIVDRAYASYSAATGLTTVMPADDTIPQVTEGTEILSATITPKDTNNRVRATVSMFLNTSPATVVSVAALFVNGAADAVQATCGHTGNTGRPMCLTMHYEYVPGSVSTQTISVRVGTSAAGTAYVNGNSSARILGGAASATLILEEISV